MKPEIVIRSETDRDIDAITELTIAAFKTLAVSNQTEPFIIQALREARALTVSLVAELDGRVIGHIAFSPVTLSDGTPNWYGLGPVSVLPEYQRQGIGKALIEEGLSRLKELNARGCCLVGHPEYYRKFGFDNPPGLAHEGVPQEVFFALSFDGHPWEGSCFTNMLKEYAKMAADYPEMTGQLRAALEASAAMMMSNNPEAVSEFRKVAKEVDAFLHACQTGEIDPRTLWERLDKEV